MHEVQRMKLLNFLDSETNAENYVRIEWTVVCLPGGMAVLRSTFRPKVIRMC